ncbi:MAG: alginate lyase family protein [bacterium]
MKGIKTLNNFSIVTLIISFLFLAVSSKANNSWIPLSSVSTFIESPGPNLLLTKRRIVEVKSAISTRNQIALAAYNDLIREADQLLYSNPNPIHGVIKIPPYYSSKREIQRMFSRQIGTDALSAYTLALAYAFSEKKAYADKSLEILHAWIENCTKPEDGGSLWDIITLSSTKEGDTPIVISYHFPKFIMAFDILQGLGVISNEDKTRFRIWLKPFVDYICKYKPLLPNNHLSWKALFLLNAGRVLGDVNVFSEGLNTLRHALRIQIAWDGSMPLELIRRDRASSYTLMNLEALVQGIWIAENHGVSILQETHSILGGNIRMACKNFKDFLLNPFNWHSRYKLIILSKEIKYPGSSSDWAWVFEIPLNWYPDDSELNQQVKSIIGDRIYGKYPFESYTMQFATLLFHRL